MLDLTDFCNETRNWFETEKHFGTFTINNGDITEIADFVQYGQYYRIVGSAFNDGVYQYPATGPLSETFTGAIWVMAVPPAAITLVKKMQEWETKYGNSEAANSPFQSESFGGYSYSKGYNSSSNGGDITVSWQKQFKNQLKRWRKI